MVLRKSMKMYVVISLITVIVFLVSGCFNTTENYLARYERFLNYSLGEFEVIIDGELRDAGDVSPKTWHEWIVEYTHQNGEEHQFQFTNNASKNGNTADFGRLVLRHATLNIGDEIEREIAKQYFIDEPLVELSVRASHSFHGMDGNPSSVVEIIGVSSVESTNTQSALNLDPYAHVINSRTGLRLNTITAQELVTDCGVNFGISVAVRDYEIYEYIIEQTKEMVRTMSAYLEQDQVEIRFRFRDHDFDGEPPFEDFQLIYCRETDNFEEVVNEIINSN